jgi:hypothetical protein
VSAAFFMADQDVPDRALPERLVEGQDGCPGYPESNVNAFVRKNFYGGLRGSHPGHLWKFLPLYGKRLHKNKMSATQKFIL